MKSSRRRHFLFLGGIVVIILGLLGGIFLFTRKPTTTQFAFSPSPTAVPTPSSYRKIEVAAKETDSWKVFSDNRLRYSVRYPNSVIIDERQTSEGRITVFIFEEDKTASLPGKVTGLYLADTGKSGVDGFSAFSRGDCGSECTVSYTDSDWITFGNVYGVKNPLPDDVHNYYLTDQKMSGAVLNAYVGGYTAVEDKEVQRKIGVFEEMIKTIQFNR